MFISFKFQAVFLLDSTNCFTCVNLCSSLLGQWMLDVSRAVRDCSCPYEHILQLSQVYLKNKQLRTEVTSVNGTSRAWTSNDRHLLWSSSGGGHESCYIKSWGTKNSGQMKTTCTEKGNCLCVSVCVHLLCRNNDGQQGVFQRHRWWNMTTPLSVQILLH